MTKWDIPSHQQANREKSVISIDAKQPFDKIQHPCMIKSFYHFRNRNKQQKIRNIKLAKDLEDSYASPLHHQC